MDYLRNYVPYKPQESIHYLFISGMFVQTDVGRRLVNYRISSVIRRFLPSKINPEDVDPSYINPKDVDPSCKTDLDLRD